MSFLSSLVHEAAEQGTAWSALGALLAGIVIGRERSAQRNRVKTIFFLFALHLLLLPIVAMLASLGRSGADDLRIASHAFAVLSLMTAIGAAAFLAVLPRLKINIPRILQDVAVATLSVMALLIVLSRSGINVSSLVATSAIMTAVIGLSLQDTFGNIIGGLALQTDDSIRVGDWVKVGDISGRVLEVRWRYTAIETRNWETVFLPNSFVIKNQVTVQGRRSGQPRQWRRWVWFNVDYRSAPPTVIATINAALTGDIPNVSKEPGAHCILMDFGESFGRYAVRYWLTDPAVDDPTDNLVRQRIFFALQRNGMSPAIPAHAVFMTKENSARANEKSREEIELRSDALAKIDLFSRLPREERDLLAASMRYAPFAKGEVLTRQGATAHWLYAITRGNCVVRVKMGDDEREVAELAEGHFFGEMSLLTGAERSATVVATTDVEAWRLDREAFRALVERRPEIAGEVAETLATRQVGLESARDHLSHDAAELRLSAEKQRMTDKIMSFFGLEARK